MPTFTVTFQLMTSPSPQGTYLVRALDAEEAFKEVVKRAGSRPVESIQVQLVHFALTRDMDTLDLKALAEHLLKTLEEPKPCTEEVHALAEWEGYISRAKDLLKRHLARMEEDDTWPAVRVLK